MTTKDIRNLEKELKALMLKYNVYIAFTCVDSSDTHGLVNDRIVIRERNTDNNIIESDGWHLYPSDL
jgi:hypothetical protein